MKLNSFYFSREPVTQNQSEARVLTEVVNLGEYRSDTLYVFIDSKMWEIAKKQKQSEVQNLDGISIVTNANER
jgi:hypothetical protein